MGIIVVDQSPASLADAVIRNTNTKIILRITDSEEAERIGSSLGLSKEEYRDLHDLEDGEAVVKVKNAGKALKLCPGQIVEKRKLLPRFTPSQPESPEYFNAAKSLHEFEQIVEFRRQVSVEELSGILYRLFDTAPTNPEARRFFLQKALGVACEGASRTVQARVTDDPTITSAVLLLAGILNLPEANSLSRQLYFILSRTPWEAAREAFEVTPTALISALESELRSFQCWCIMGGAQHFANHLVQTSNLESDPSNRERAFEQAMISANLSPERTGSLKSLLLYLAF
jgi:hypothetical protein